MHQPRGFHRATPLGAQNYDSTTYQEVKTVHTVPVYPDGNYCFRPSVVVDMPYVYIASWSQLPKKKRPVHPSIPIPYEFEGMCALNRVVSLWGFLARSISGAKSAANRTRYSIIACRAAPFWPFTRSDPRARGLAFDIWFTRSVL